MSVHEYYKKSGKVRMWYVKYQNKTKRGFKTKKQAIDFDNQMKTLKENDLTNIDLRTLSEDFLADKKTKTEYGTFDEARRMINNIILPNVDADKSIYLINAREAKKFRDYLHELSYKYTYKNKILNTYKEMFKYAEKYYELEKNPTIHLERFSKTLQDELEEKEREKDVWNFDDFGKFINEVENEKYKVFFIVSFMTGCRKGEILATNWHDLDLKEGTLNINKNYSKKCENASYIIKKTKNPSSIRNIKLNEELVELFCKYKELEMKSEFFKEDNFIFGGRHPFPPTNLDNAKRKAVNKSGVRYIKFHDFRHSHASILMNAGINKIDVAKRLGHSDLNTLLKIYTHAMKKEKDEINEFLSKSSQNLLTENKKAL